MKIGDLILHPRYGVGKIESIEDRELNGEIKQYYVVPKIGMASVIYIPLDVADDSGVRYLYPKEYMETAIEVLKGNVPPKEHPQEFRAIDWSDPMVLASAIFKRAITKKGKYPKMSEVHQLKRAQKLLSEELIAVLNMTEDEAAEITDIRYLLRQSEAAERERKEREKANKK